MRVAKKETYSKKQLEIAKLTKAMGHPARVAIIDYLLEVNSCICNDIVNILPLAQSTVSQHLKALKNAGIIQGTIEGNAICYCINDKMTQILHSYFNTMQNRLENLNKNCC